MRDLVLIVLTSLFLFGCGSALPRRPVPQSLVQTAQIPGMPETVRFWGDASPKNLSVIAAKKTAQMRRRYAAMGKRVEGQTLNFLAISGGGSWGAFGAGLLNGWTRRGTRPQFEIVTGISTGALTAPFAFLGPKYDARLKEIYTTISTKDVLRERLFTGLTGGPSIADSAPLFRLISKYMTPAILKEIAHAHAKGRRLFVGTTNADAERPVIWDMGEIASSRHPGALMLFRKILLASASIPGAFPPIVIKVNAGGRFYDEMHVDGGMTSHVFLYPAQLDMKMLSKKHRLKVKRRLYIIRNGKVSPEWRAIKADFFSVAGRSVTMMSKSLGISDTIKLYLIARRDKLDYNLAFMPREIKDTSKETFDRVFMNKLYQAGFKLGRNGYPWAKRPPSLAAVK